MSQKKRYALVGSGGRAVMYTDAINGAFKDHAELVGICDLSPTRMAWHNRRRADKFQLPAVDTFTADQFDKMVQTKKPDVVIVTSMDCTHDQYIIRAMELGCDAITEKPMTTDAVKARAIFQTIERTGRKLRVTFNYRYTQGATKVYEMLRQGVVGRPTIVDFAWLLDTSHGADYFRRWHSEKDKSGGLLVHKATHHFDLINFWLRSFPKSVYCLGDLAFYGRKAAEGRGEKYSYSRYTGEPAAAKDPFALTLDKDPHLRELYYEAEKDSGYIRDRNVFADHVNIEDTMAITARYRSGTIMNYTLVAYSPWEGLSVSVTGTKGRLEYFDKHGSHIIAGQSDDELALQQARGHVETLKVFPMFGIPYEVEIPKATGGHGGGDRLILEQIFLPNPPADPFGRDASHIDGAASCLLGFAANESIRTGLPVACDSLLKLPEPASAPVAQPAGAR